MVLGEHYTKIASTATLKRLFHPFSDVWQNVKRGNYSEFLNEFYGREELSKEILYVTKCILSKTNPISKTEKNINIYNDYVSKNQKMINKIRKSTNVDTQENHADILYLCVLIHVQADYVIMENETADFIIDLLTDKNIFVPEYDISKKIRIIQNEPHHLHNGRIVSMRTSNLLPYTSEISDIVSFDYSEGLGLIAIDINGKLHLNNLKTNINTPPAVKFINVSICLSRYMLLDSEGNVYTNMELKNKNQWKNIQNIFVGLNSACGIKKSNGSIVSVGCETKLEKYTDVAYVRTYCDYEKRFIVLWKNGTAETDEGTEFNNVIAIAISNKGYYYASDNKIYMVGFDKKESEIVGEYEGIIREITVFDGNVICD